MQVFITIILLTLSNSVNTLDDASVQHASLFLLALIQKCVETTLLIYKKKYRSICKQYIQI